MFAMASRVSIMILVLWYVRSMRCSVAVSTANTTAIMPTNRSLYRAKRIMLNTASPSDRYIMNA